MFAFPLFYLLYLKGLDRSVGIATGYGLDGNGSIPGRERFFSCP
jgi:hypothetical protein